MPLVNNCDYVNDYTMEIFENICRTCGNDCLDAINIFMDSIVVMEKDVLISEIIAECLPASACASLSPPAIDDNYPKQICRVCIKKLVMIYEFNQKWLAASSEFGVALKFEQRRNRSRASQSQQPITEKAEQTPIKFTVKTLDANDEVIDTDDSIMFKHEPNEFELELISDKELHTKSNLAAAPTNYQCALCEEQFHTLAAYQKHHKVSHRDCQFIFYTPEQ